ncbi:MAG: hypothetical protein KKB75_01260 [Alphaproteobacteria bacterium]|nr:hypothetical protein [Alphaproteobacteria bacterium]MBU2144694.1 hypothetical protein [Alphaproteobacteria bacterium]MBU2195291.1 hypothetical protein [Alphaproteobacteria bacterium]
MSHKNTIALLESLLRPEQEAPPTFLLGAGASYSSGVPLAAESVNRLARQYYAERVAGGGMTPDKIKTSQWKSWLNQQDWFIADPDRLAENFPLIIHHLLSPEAYRRRLIVDLVEPPGEVSSGYKALAELVLRGLASTILTTNFDPCLPRALDAKRPHLAHVDEVNRQPGDFAEFSPYSRAQIVWLHGKAELYSDKNLAEETEALAPELVERMRPLIENTPLVVVGYRGAEKSITDSLLGSEDGPAFRRGIYWCHRKGETPHPRVQALADRLGRNFTWLEIDGFDELMTGLNKRLSGVQRYAVSAENDDLSYDDTVMEGAVWGDIDHSLALATLRDYSEKLEFGELTSDQLQRFMEDRGLLKRIDGALRPTRGAILLFGRDANRFFPHAMISVTVDGKDRRNIRGNLLTQYDELLQWLSGDRVNPSIKVKGARKHENRRSYHDRALTELAVNLLVHRDYEASAVSTVNVLPGSAIEFRNPGDASSSLRSEIEFDEEGAFRPVAEVTDLRNRSLCDVFFGISAMEQGGTGLVDADELTRKNGGVSRFAFPPGADTYIARLCPPSASAGSARIAKDLRPVGIYTVNMMMFSSMPTHVTCATLDLTHTDFWKTEGARAVEPCVFEPKSQRLWTFATQECVEDAFRDALNGEAEPIALADIGEDEDIQRKITWLLRRHVEVYLKGFEASGLLIERTPKGRPTKRAYFTALRGGNRAIKYDTPQKRGITRTVVKRRGDESKGFFECEGFGYDVVRLSETWALRIKPFYMFLDKDGKTPLPGYVRTKLSTRRYKYDRNAAVNSDLGFFEQFLRGGQQAINLGAGVTDDLILEGAFLSVETEEIGLLYDDEAADHKRTA